MTLRPTLARLIDQQSRSLRATEVYRTLAHQFDALADLPRSCVDPVAQEIAQTERQRLLDLADEMERDADDCMEQIMERFTPEQFEAARAS